MENKEEDKIRQDYEAVCSKLNMDQTSMDSAWASYVNTNNYYALEVCCVWGEMEWLASYLGGLFSLNTA